MTEYFGQFLLWFHALIDVDSLTENQFIYWFNVFTCFVPILCLLSPLSLWPQFSVCVTQASKVQVLLGNSSMIFCRPTDHHSFTYSLICWLKVVVGFKFNNSDKYVSLTDVLPTQTISVVPPPVISRSSVITDSRWLITNITITVSCRRPTADDDNSRSFLSSTRLCNECCLTYHVAQINCLQNRVTDIFTIS